MTEKVIPFDVQDRLLARVRMYLGSPDILLQEADQAVGVLCKALKIADKGMRLKIVLLLGTLASPRVVWPLYKVMNDADECESIRHAAAVQLSVLGSLLDNTDPLVEQLSSDVHGDDPVTRANAAFALGWEGNRNALRLLVQSLYDPDPEVQQAAVCALVNINEESVFGVLVERLGSATKDQKRSILFNLHRFSAHRREAMNIYRQFIQGGDPDLRYDALLVFEAVAKQADRLPIFCECLQDHDTRIREMVLNRLLAASTPPMKELQPYIENLVKDPEPKVRQAAIKLYNRMRPSALLN
jgi:HEAT repeat protein